MDKKSVQENETAFPSVYDFSGWLEIRQKETKPFVKHFAVLKNNFLLLAEGPNATALKKVLPLQNCEVSEVQPNGVLQVRLSLNKLVEIRCEKKDECSIWQQRISRASKLKIKDIYQLHYICKTIFVCLFIC